jgi:hypothetical protein
MYINNRKTTDLVNSCNPFAVFNDINRNNIVGCFICTCSGKLTKTQPNVTLNKIQFTMNSLSINWQLRKRRASF